MTGIIYALAFVGALMLPILGFIVLPAWIGLDGPAFRRRSKW